MAKILTLVILGLMICNLQFAVAKQKDTLAQPSNTASYSTDADEDFNFNENSYYVSDEQTVQSEDSSLNEKTNFDQKVINSGHFSSDTATKTWIPVNKVE